MQERTREQFALVAEQVHKRHPGTWREIDASGTIEQVEDRIRHEVDGLVMEDKKDGGLGRLWM
jgi:thymidylate kinase